jgi:hypothetical protein
MSRLTFINLRPSSVHIFTSIFGMGDQPNPRYCPPSFTCLWIISGRNACPACSLRLWDLLHVTNGRSDISGLQFLKTCSPRPTRVQDGKCIASGTVTTRTSVDFLPICANGGVHTSATSLAGSNVCAFIIPQAHGDSKKSSEVIEAVVRL